MARSINHRRSIGVILVVQLTALLCPKSHVGVQSFVLRSRSIDDLAAALANVDSNEESDSDDGIEDADDTRVDFLDQPSSWSNHWNADYSELERPITGIYNDFEDVSDEDDDRIQRDEDDLTPDEKVFQAIGSKGDDDVIVDDSDVLGQEESSQSIADGKIPLNKSELKELFDIVTPETVTEAFPAVTVAKKSELTKNEVESLFEKITDIPAAPDKEELKAVIVSSTGNISEARGSNGAASAVSPSVKVTTLEEVVKAVAKEKNGDAGSESGEKDVVLDVKEEKLSPSGDEKLTKEWLVQLTQPEDEKQEDRSGGDLYSVDDRWRGGNRKFKRSLPPALSDASFEEQETTVDGKSRAVELLKAYIMLQEEENRHLTEALDLATLGQAENTDRYLDGQIEYLRQAVDDERSIEAIRALIRAEEDLEEDDDGDDEDSADESQQDETVIDELPMAFKRSQSDLDEEKLSPIPELIAFDAEDADDNGYVVTDSDRGNDVIVDGDDEEERLKEKLREFALQNELDEIRQAADVAVEAEADDSGRSPEVVYLPPMNYRTTFRDPRFNPFLRDFEEKLGYRPRFVATKRFEPIRIQKYADEFDEEEDSAEEEEAAAERRREVLAEVEAAVKAAEEEEQRRAFIENLEEALQLPASLNAVDVNEGDEERPLPDSAFDLCPAVQELTDNCLVARERGLALDDEALQLCNRHQLCYSCGDQYGLMPDACDRGYLAEADRLCSDSLSSASSSSRCRREAASLYVMMLDGHRAHSGSGYSAPEACRQPCTFHFIVGTTAGARR